ncbi:MAG TPA: ribosomal protein L7/L12 [Candidatus Obscuribacterales bacterium]
MDMNTLGMIFVGVTVLLVAMAFFKRSGKAEYYVDKPTMADVERLAKAGHKIPAIKAYRQIHGVGLKEAKDAVDRLDQKR